MCGDEEYLLVFIGGFSRTHLSWLPMNIDANIVLIIYCVTFWFLLCLFLSKVAEGWE